VAYFAAGCTYPRVPGEKIYIGLATPDRKQASVLLSYVRGTLRSVPALAALIVNETKDSIELSNGVVIEIFTANDGVRGRAFALFIADEFAFLPTDDAADPDTALLQAVRPALARVPGSMLVCISSPYAKRGELWRTYQERYGQNDDDVLVIMADTLTLNATFSRREIERAHQADSVAAASEYGWDGHIVFRSDIASFISEQALRAVVAAGVTELPPDLSREAKATFDAATGTSGENADSAVAAVAFSGPAELAAQRRFVPPFDPADAIAEASALFRRYGVFTVTIDRFAPGLVAAMFRRHGIECEVNPRDTSAVFGELLTAISARRVRLLDDPVLLRELGRLERRPSSAGRDVISHPRGGHDDVAAACGAALVLAGEADDEQPIRLLFGSQWKEEQAQAEAAKVRESAAARFVEQAAGAVKAVAERVRHALTPERESEPAEAPTPEPEIVKRTPSRLEEKVIRGGGAWLPQDEGRSRGW
jgi:hypothetical protein